MSRNFAELIKRYGDCTMTVPDVAEFLGTKPESVRAFCGRVINPLPHFYLPSESSKPQKKILYSQLIVWLEREQRRNGVPL